MRMSFPLRAAIVVAALAVCFTSAFAAPSVLLADGSNYPTVTLAVDPGQDGTAGLEQATVVEGRRGSLPVTLAGLGQWTVMAVVDCGPAAARNEATLRAALSALAAALPEGTRTGVVLAGPEVRLLGVSSDLAALANLPPGVLGGTHAHLRDGLLAAMTDLRRFRGPRAIAIVMCGPDEASHVAGETLAEIAPYLGYPILGLALGGVDTRLAEAATASGGMLARADDPESAVAAAAALSGRMRRAVGLSYQGPPAVERGAWRTGVLRAPEGGSRVSFGYLVPPAPDSPTATVAIDCPVLLPPTPIAFHDLSTGAVVAWSVDGQPVPLRQAAYRAVIGSRPPIVRAIRVGAAPVALTGASFGALRLLLPSRYGPGAAYGVVSELGNRRVGEGRAGEWLPLEPGQYSLGIEDRPLLDLKHIGVSARATSTVDLSDWATLDVDLARIDGSPALYTVELRRPDETRGPSGLTNQPFLVPPGLWAITTLIRPARTVNVNLAPEGDRKIELDPLGSLVVRLLGPDGSPVDWAWTATPLGETEQAAAGTTNKPTDLAAGDYTVDLVSWGGTGIEAHIDSGRETEQYLGALVSLTVTIQGQDGSERRLKYTLVDSDSGLAVANGLTGQPQDVLPGEYDLDVWTYPHLVLGRVGIRPGEDGLLHLGALGSVHVTGPAGARVGLYLVREDEEPLPAAVAVAGAGPDVELLPGEYVARVLEPKGASCDPTVSVRATEVARVRVAAPEAP